MTKWSLTALGLSNRELQEWIQLNCRRRLLHRELAVIDLQAK